MADSIDNIITEAAEVEAEATAVETTSAMAGNIANALPDTSVDVNTSSAAADVNASLDLHERYRAIAREEIQQALADERRNREAEAAAAAAPEPEPTIVVVAPTPEPETAPAASSESEVFPDAQAKADEAPPKSHPYYRSLRRRK